MHVSTENQRYQGITYLAPARRTDTDREDGKEPRMDFAEPGEECEEGSPYTDEEDENEDKNIQLLELGTPQEGPVLSVGLCEGRLGTNKLNGQSRTHPAQPVIAQHQREEEPQHELTTEKCIVEVWNLWWGLTVVLCVRGQPNGQKPRKDPRMDD